MYWNFDNVISYIIAKRRKEGIDDIKAMYVGQCLYLLATDRRAKEMQTLNEILEVAKGTKQVVKDDRTSEEIINDTIELFEGLEF